MKFLSIPLPPVLGLQAVAAGTHGEKHVQHPSDIPSSRGSVSRLSFAKVTPRHVFLVTKTDGPRDHPMECWILISASHFATSARQRIQGPLKQRRGYLMSSRWRSSDRSQLGIGMGFWSGARDLTNQVTRGKLLRGSQYCLTERDDWQLRISHVSRMRSVIAERWDTMQDCTIEERDDYP